MSEFLKDFLPTLALMMVPFAIPVVAVAIGTIRDALSGESRVRSVEDQVRDLRASREVPSHQPALDAA